MKKYGYAESDMRAGFRASAPRWSATERLPSPPSSASASPLDDMIGEFEKPGRDVRDALPAAAARKGDSLEDLKVGMTMTGVVRNVVDSRRVVDIGVHQDGLVHISRLSDSFVSIRRMSCPGSVTR